MTITDKCCASIGISTEYDKVMKIYDTIQVKFIFEDRVDVNIAFSYSSLWG